MFLHWPHRLLDRKQVDDEESVEDDEDDEFLKGFKVLRSSFITGIMPEEVLRFLYALDIHCGLHCLRNAYVHMILDEVQCTSSLFCISMFVCELVRSEYNVIGIFYLNAF